MKYEIWNKFAKYVHEPITIKNNNINGILCHPASLNEDFQHIDIIYENGETEDCKKYGPYGIYINQKSLCANTTWISSIIDGIDYKVRRQVLYDNIFHKLTVYRNKTESGYYIHKDEFKSLAEKYFVVREDFLNLYITADKQVSQNDTSELNNIYNKILLA